MNKFIEELVEKTFDRTEADACMQWDLLYVAELKCYWLKEKNWFFPESFFLECAQSGEELPPEMELANLFETHHSSKFFVKKNEGQNTLVLYIQTQSEKLAA